MATKRKTRGFGTFETRNNVEDFFDPDVGDRRVEKIERERIKRYEATTGKKARRCAVCGSLVRPPRQKYCCESCAEVSRTPEYRRK